MEDTIFMKCLLLRLRKLKSDACALIARKRTQGHRFMKRMAVLSAQGVEVNHKKGKTMLWEEAIEQYKFPNFEWESYTEGFKSGWFDSYLGYDSMIARKSPWGHYAIGYVDGRISYHAHNPVIQEGEVTCLKNLLV